MKKLMFAAAVAASMVAFGEITSQNVVGYAGNGLQKGSTIVTPQFLGITDGSKIELQTIKCGPNDSDCVVLSLLDAVGYSYKSYNWVNYGGESGEEECWIDPETGAKPETPVYFEPGQALWIEAESTENVFTTSGEVGTKDVTVTLCKGATMTGNPSPVQIELQDITCGPNDSDCVVLSLLDAVGYSYKSYNWVNYGGESGEEECWIDPETGAKPEEPVYFQPGEGLWIEADSTANTITFPGVEL